MNHITQKNWLEKRLKIYKDYVPFCPNDSLQNLIREMQVTMNRIESIRLMPVDELMKEVPCQYETKQSKSNFKTI